jgi:histidyl-tRNA synthetase
LVRGLDYYVRTTFELKSSHLGAQNAVAGGGRYDGLVALLGGPPDPGIGFAIGIERVASLLSQTDINARERRRPFAVLVPLDGQALKQLLPVAQAVRGRGIPVELGYGDRKLRAELDRANRLKVRYVVIVGETELSTGQATLREMTSGTQRTVPLARLVEELVALGGRS